MKYIFNSIVISLVSMMLMTSCNPDKGGWTHNADGTLTYSESSTTTVITTVTNNPPPPPPAPLGTEFVSYGKVDKIEASGVNDPDGNEYKTATFSFVKLFTNTSGEIVSDSLIQYNGHNGNSGYMSSTDYFNGHTSFWYEGGKQLYVAVFEYINYPGTFKVSNGVTSGMHTP